MEIWKNIEGFDGVYQVSTFGNIRSLKFGREMILKPQLNLKMYYKVTLWKQGIPNRLFIHRIVASTFLKVDPNKNVVNHKNLDKLDNSLENLEWVSFQENIDHAIKNNAFIVGSKRKGAKLNEKKVLQIRKLIGVKSNGEIAKMFEISKTQIIAIKYNREWRHVKNE